MRAERPLASAATEMAIPASTTKYGPKPVSCVLACICEPSHSHPIGTAIHRDTLPIAMRAMRAALASDWRCEPDTTLRD